MAKQTKETRSKTLSSKNQLSESKNITIDSQNNTLTIDYDQHQNTFFNSGLQLRSFYYQVNQENLNIIFDWGIICPSKYVHENKTKADLQDKYKSFILLSNQEIYYEDSVSQILVEIVLMQGENPISTIDPNLFFYDKPIPISRIKKIIYSDKSYWDSLKSMVNNDSINFIPFELGVFNKDIIFKTFSEIRIELESKDYTNDLSKYDRRLGALAYMKNADLYYGNYSNYSKHYIDVLHIIDPETFKESNNFQIDDTLSKLMGIKEEGEIYKFIYSGGKIDKKYIDDFLDKHYPNKNDDTFKLLKNNFGSPFSICKNKYIELLAKGESLSPYFRIAFIAIYGDKSPSSSTSIQLKHQFANEVKDSEEADILLAMLGLYFGYKFLRPHDIISIQNEDFLSKYINRNTNIKFRLNTVLDYLTIESVYQLTFNHRAKDLTPILSYAQQNKTNYNDQKIFNDLCKSTALICEKRKVYDVEFFRIIKKDIKKDILDKLNKNYDEKISARFAVFSWVYKFFFQKGIIRFDGDIYVLKSDLMIKLNEDIPNMELLNRLIEFDKANKNHESFKPYR